MEATVVDAYFDVGVAAQLGDGIGIVEVDGR